MSAFFPKIVDKYVRIGGIVATVGVVAGIALFSYLTYPTVLKTGYQPVQPVPYSHKLHAGNMGAKQGLENVVEAARLADQRGSPITFVLMGAGNQRSRLTALARGIRSIQFLEPLPDGEFETAVATADVLVLNERPQVAEHVVGAGALFGKSDANGAAAGEGARLLTLSAPKFAELCERYPRLGIKLYRNLAALQA